MSKIMPKALQQWATQITKREGGGHSITRGDALEVLALQCDDLAEMSSAEAAEMVSKMIAFGQARLEKKAK